MFIVSSPLSLLWHPSVHHSLLLLRLLKQPHSLEVSDNGSRDRYSLLSTGAIFTSFMGESSPIKKVYVPDHILHIINFSENRGANSLCQKLHCDISSYLGAVAVTGHILNCTETLIHSMGGNDVELMRRSHASLLLAIEKLEDTLMSNPSDHNSTETQMSAAAIFPTLKFLIEEGCLLQSAFPNISTTYQYWSRSSDMTSNSALVLERVEKSTGRDQVCIEHPLRGFLSGIHSKLMSYTSSFEEKNTQDVQGDGGALKSRISGGRFSVQSVPARVPWTRQNSPLPFNRG